MPAATGLPRDPPPLHSERPPSSTEGPGQQTPTLAMNDLDPRSPPRHCINTRLPTAFKLEGAVGPAQQLPHKRARCSHRSTDAAFISLVTDGGSIWGLFVRFFSPWLLLLLSSIFNFPINQRVVLFLSHSCWSRTPTVGSASSSSCQETGAWARGFSPSTLGRNWRAGHLGPSPQCLHLFT